MIDFLVQLVRNLIEVDQVVVGWVGLYYCVVVVVYQYFGDQKLGVVGVGLNGFIGVGGYDGDEVVGFQLGYVVGQCQVVVGFVDGVDYVGDDVWCVG